MGHVESYTDFSGIKFQIWDISGKEPQIGIFGEQHEKRNFSRTTTSHTGFQEDNTFDIGHAVS